jgi:hypothetical protein
VKRVEREVKKLGSRIDFIRVSASKTLITLVVLVVLSISCSSAFIPFVNLGARRGATSQFDRLTIEKRQSGDSRSNYPIIASCTVSHQIAS